LIGKRVADEEGSRSLFFCGGRNGLGDENGPGDDNWLLDKEKFNFVWNQLAPTPCLRWYRVGIIKLTAHAIRKMQLPSEPLFT